MQFGSRGVGDMIWRGKTTRFDSTDTSEIMA